MSKSKTFWPKGIALSIFGIVLLSIYTVYFALQNPVQTSNDHLTDYRIVDKNINALIEANLAFYKIFHVEYLGTPLNTKETIISYRITTQDGKPVNDATIDALLTRPNQTRDDIKLELEQVSQGLYTFKSVSLPLEGRWNLFANFKHEDAKGYHQIGLDTRYPNEIKPYGVATPMN